MLKVRLFLQSLCIIIIHIIYEPSQVVKEFDLEARRRGSFILLFRSTSCDFKPVPYLNMTLANEWDDIHKISPALCFLTGIVAKHMPQGGTLNFCGYIGKAPTSTPKPKKLLRFADNPPKIPVLSGIPKKIHELLAYPKKLHVFIFFMAIFDNILSHPYDLSCWWDVKSQINQPTEHVTIQLVYVGTRK